MLKESVENLVRRVVVEALRGVPVPVWERIAPKDVISLVYHTVSDQDLRHLRLYTYKNPAQFESDVIYARANAVGYDDVANHRHRSARMPPNRVLFTFDDGLAECFHVIRPILRKHSVPAIFFVNTSFLDDRETFFETTLSRCLDRIEQIDQKRAEDIFAELAPSAVQRARPVGSVELGRNRLRNARARIPRHHAHQTLALWLLGFEEDGRAEIDRAWELLQSDSSASVSSHATCMTTAEVKQLAAEGFVLGSHGATHLPMQRLDARTLEERIVSSCETVRELSGQRRVPFAFPYTGLGIDRGILADILRRNPFIDLLFDTLDFTRDAEFMVQRICADRPPADGGSTSNLPLLMRTAWSRRSAWYRART